MKTTKQEKFNLDEDRFKKLLANRKFQNRVLGLRKKYGIPKGGFKDNKSEYAKKDEYSQSELDEMQHDLYEIINDFDVLSGRWYQVLRWYLFNNTPMMLRAQSSYVLRFDYEGNVRDPKNIQMVYIGVDSKTTQEELLEGFEAAKEYLPVKPTDRHTYAIDKILYAQELRKATDLTWSEIADEVNQKFRSDYDFDSMRQAVKRLGKSFQ